MEKMILVFSIVSFCAVSIGTGFLLGAIQTGEMSNQFSEVLGGISSNFSSPSPAEALTNDVQNAIDTATVSFELTIVKNDPDNTPDSGDESFDNVISSCKFHSTTSIQTDTCIICTLKDDLLNPLGSGQIDLKEYESSSTIPIQITDVTIVGANNFKDVKNVEIKVCQLGNGCSVEFWKIHWERWFNTGYSTEDSFKTVFGIIDENFKLTIDGEDNLNPTLMEALSAEGQGLNALAREAVAALLNSTTNIDFPISEDELQVSFYLAYETQDYDATVEIFSNANNQYCPFEQNDIELISETNPINEDATD